MTRDERLAALELEAQRIKGRLDELEAQIQGRSDAWLGITEKLGGEVAEVYVDKVLAEARQQALAYATLVKTYETLTGERPAELTAGAEDDLEKRRREREAARLAQ